MTTVDLWLALADSATFLSCGRYQSEQPFQSCSCRVKSEGECGIAVISGNDRFLVILARDKGFFSLLFQVLGYVEICERSKLVPVVYFNRNCQFWADRGYRGSRNVWEYYFEPLTSYNIEDLLSVPKSSLEDYTVDDFEQRFGHTGIRFTSTYPPVIDWRWQPKIESQRKFVHNLICTHIRINQAILDRVKSFWEERFKGFYVIGVHYRGAEKRLGITKDDVSVGGDLCVYYLREIGEQLKRRHCSKVFIATDSQQFLNKVLELFPDRVVYSQSRRLAPQDEAIGLHYADVRGPEIGDEVLIDALLLGRCEYLIHGLSNVSTAALCFNPDLRHVDIEWKYRRLRKILVEVRRSVRSALRRFLNCVIRRPEKLKSRCLRG